MKDGFGREIDYLRISVTDKCNLRCRYCMPAEGVERIPHEELLSLEELSRLVAIMAGLGVRKVRFTGGEPLVRKNFGKLIEDVHRIEGIEEIAVTTNGVLLEEQMPRLLRAGLAAVNISLDTLDPDTFQKITGTDACEKVLSALECAAKSQLRTKVNCVPCREWNQDELWKVAMLAKKWHVDVRFIELMPVGCGSCYHGIPSREVLDQLQEHFGQAKALENGGKRGNGPARYYEFQDFRGKIGTISPMSHKFCAECNRVRLMADGRLKLCLHYDTGIELKPLLRGGASDDEIRAAVLEAMAHKPKAHDFWHEEKNGDAQALDSRKMVQIGG